MIPAPSSTNLPESSPSPWPRLILRSRDQFVVAAVVAVSLGIIVAWCAWQGQLRGRLIDIDHAEPLDLSFQLDINRADWLEIALLPDIGEQLAKRIVADRAAHGPFRDVTDLRRVPGIGPHTLESMRPYLAPVQSATATLQPSGDALPKGAN